MIYFPHCKINLGLHITARRKDGFHELETVFYPVPWCDALELIVREEPGVKLFTSGLPVQGDPSNNLVTRAYQLLSQDRSLPGAEFHLHKVIPMGAGLGGGSADAAFALKLMNEVFELGIDLVKLKENATVLGSDCAFFIEDKPAFATGRGEQLMPIECNLTGWHILLVVPDIHIGTAEAYSWITPAQPEFDIRALVGDDPTTWNEHLRNDFEAAVCARHPQIAEIKDDLYRAGAVYASMSGSGSAVFGLFNQAPDTERWREYRHWTGRLS
jgi:4-diphosphocytidyl-2-C-methyl-D-erythritol kinase